MHRVLVCTYSCLLMTTAIEGHLLVFSPLQCLPIDCSILSSWHQLKDQLFQVAPGRYSVPPAHHFPAAFSMQAREKKSDQLMSLQFQPAISASSTARRDFAKIHIRQLLRTLLFCLYHPEHAVCLSCGLSL